MGRQQFLLQAAARNKLVAGPDRVFYGLLCESVCAGSSIG